MATISIIMPIYNAQDTLPQALDAICNQDFEDMEIILIDDGSTDQSFAICQKYQEKDSRIQLVHQQNQGSGSARNYGLSKVTGKYVYFPDADDIVHPQAISVMVKEMENSLADMVVFSYRSINRKTGKITEKICKDGLYTGEQFRQNPVDFTADCDCKILGSAWNKCFRMEVIQRLLQKYPSAFADMRRNEEEVFLMRYMDIAKKISSIPDVLYDFYPIDLKKAWERLPDNYCELVEQFKEERLTFSRSWGCLTKDMQNFIHTEYYGKMYLGLKLCFNPKSGWSFPTRYSTFKKRVEQLVQGIGLNVPPVLENSMVYRLMKMKQYFILYCMIKRQV
jgi:glycosyltransferase involved in cell wall biosynthesis